MSEARQHNKDFGGLCEGQLIYPGSKMSGVICKRKPRGGYLFYLDTHPSVAAPNNLLT